MPATLEKLVKIRSQFAEEVLSYLQEVQHRLGKLPRFYPRHFQFDEVRVRVKVREERQKYDEALERERERLRREGWDDFDEERRSPYQHRSLPESEEEEKRPEVKILDWDKEVRQQVQRGVILGDPGFGKTWVLRYEGRCISREQTENLEKGEIGLDEVVIPIFIRLSDLARTPEEIEEGVCQLIKRDYRCNGKELSDKFLNCIKDKFNTGDCRLLLDALDEVPLEAHSRQPTLGFRGELTGRLKRFVENHPRCPTLLTSRIVGYQGAPFSLANTQQQWEMELVAFDRKQQEQFVRAWFRERPDAATKLLNELRKAPQIRGFGQVPLLLGLLCKLYWHGELTLPVRRVELYEKCLYGLLGEEWKDEPRQFPEGYVDAKLELAEELAFRLFTQGKELFSARELRQCIIETLDDFPQSQDLKGKKPHELIHELSVEDGLLVKAGAGDNPPYLFIHLTFQEYLTACALAKRPDWLDEANRHFEKAKQIAGEFKITWVEPLTLLAGIVKSPLPLLEKVISELDGDYPTEWWLILSGKILAGVRENKYLSQSPQVNIKRFKQLEREIIDGLIGILEDGRSATIKRVINQVYKRVLQGKLDEEWAADEVGDAVHVAGEKRTAAAKALGETDSELAIDALIKAFKSDSVQEEVYTYPFTDLIDLEKINHAILNDAFIEWYYYSRKYISRALAQIGSERAVEELINLLLENDKLHTYDNLYYNSYEASQIGTYIAEAFERVSNEQTVKTFIKILKNENATSNSRKLAAEALGKIGDEQAVESLIEVLNVHYSDGWEYSLCESVIEALGRIGSEPAVDMLTDILTQKKWKHSYKNHNHYTTALRTVAQIDSARAMDIIIERSKESTMSDGRSKIADIIRLDVYSPPIDVLFFDDDSVRVSKA